MKRRREEKRREERKACRCMMKKKKRWTTCNIAMRGVLGRRKEREAERRRRGTANCQLMGRWTLPIKQLFIFIPKQIFSLGGWREKRDQAHEPAALWSI